MPYDLRVLDRARGAAYGRLSPGRRSQAEIFLGPRSETPGRAGSRRTARSHPCARPTTRAPGRSWTRSAMCASRRRGPGRARSSSINCATSSSNAPRTFLRRRRKSSITRSPSAITSGLLDCFRPMLRVDDAASTGFSMGSRRRGARKLEGVEAFRRDHGDSPIRACSFLAFAGGSGRRSTRRVPRSSSGSRGAAAIERRNRRSI